MPHIDYYFATISPFTYLVGTRPAEIAAKEGGADRPASRHALVWTDLQIQ